jgi:hypothetical protein
LVSQIIFKWMHSIVVFLQQPFSDSFGDFLHSRYAQLTHYYSIVSPRCKRSDPWKLWSAYSDIYICEGSIRRIFDG